MTIRIIVMGDLNILDLKFPFRTLATQGKVTVYNCLLFYFFKLLSNDGNTYYCYRRS